MRKKVAIVGMAFRFPGTERKTYWDDLKSGKDLVSSVEGGRWAQESYLHPDKSHPGTSYTFKAGSLGDVSGFDAAFFGISPREAAQMDPQQRLLLEMTWESFEDAGVKPSSVRGSRCGVFVGIASADYSYRFAEDLAVMDSSTATGNTASIAANRISYVFDLRGPSMAIDTACSSSLVAFHQACRSIAGGETAMAVAGGISLHLHPYGFIIFSKASMLSPQGLCNVFDASGDGYVRSEGGGVFLLKDHEAALADGNRILAVVETTVANTDGRKSGLTVPSGEAQAVLLREAYECAGIDPDEIDYIEAHGTGTVVGDPIETQALGEAIGMRRPEGRPLLIGSVKSNLGHLEAASGVAGLVKAVHCVQHREVPATIHLQHPNPKILFDEWNIRVARENTPLKAEGRLVLGVNSFGFGGANAHVVLSSPPEVVPAEIGETGGEWPFLLSARSPAALRDMASSFADVLERGGDGRQIAHDLIFRRDRHDCRLLLMAREEEALAHALRQFGQSGELPQGAFPATVSGDMAGPVFVYSGNGSQWQGMGHGLLDDPVFCDALRQVDALFRPLASFSLEDELAGKNGEERYARAEVAQPALFAVQVGVTLMLRSKGIRPLAVAGHSVGEVAAAWACGALDLEQAVQVIYHRSIQQGKTRGQGKMAAVALGEQVCRELLSELGMDGQLVLAGVNSARGVTVSGNVVALEVFEKDLHERQIAYKRLDLDYAFHSPAMDAVEAGILQALRDIRPRCGEIPFFSCVTGDCLQGEALTADYWWRNIREPVMFYPAMRKLFSSGFGMVIEVGPHAVLRGYVNEIMREAGVAGQFVPTLVRNGDAPQRVHDAAAQTLCFGGSVDWRVYFPRILPPSASMPFYPWQRERHWHAVTPESLGLLQRRKVHPLLGYPLAQQALVWENHLDTRLNPSLADHVVGEAAVFPGTAYVELVLAAAQQWKGVFPVDVGDLEIRSPLVFDGHTKLLRLRIDPVDGAVSILGRNHAASEDWVQHAVARITGVAVSSLLDMSCPDIPSRSPDFDAAEHHRLIRLAGLAYGPAYRAVERGWCEGKLVHAILRCPESIAEEASSHCLHPAMLDCTFQLIIHLLREELSQQAGVAYVPTRIGRLICRPGSLRPHFVEARLKRHSPHSLCCDFALFDQSGHCIARVEEARFRSVRLERQQGERVRLLGYEKIPQPHPARLPYSDSALFEGMEGRIQDALSAGEVVQESRRYAEEVEPLLDSLSQLFIRKAVSGMATKALPPAVVMMLEGDAADSPDDELVPEDIWNALLADYPDFFSILHAVGRQGMHFADLLGGRRENGPRSVAGWPEMALQVLGIGFRRAMLEAMRRIISSALERLPEGQRLRIAKLATDRPLFAVDLCQVIDFDRCDYILITQDNNLASCQEIRERFPQVQLLAQADLGEALPRVHLVMLPGNFGDEGDVEESLESGSEMLLPAGGLFFFGVVPSAWMDFVTASEYLWGQEAESSSQKQRLAPPQTWVQRLKAAGLAEVSLFQPLGAGAAGGYVLLARKPEMEAEAACGAGFHAAGRHCLLISSDDPAESLLRQGLASCLREKGCQVQFAKMDVSVGELLDVLSSQKAEAADFDHIVLLPAVNTERGQSDRAAFSTETERCALAARVAQACEALGSKARLCFLSSSSGSGDPVRAAGDASLWGFGRTLMNERAQSAIRLLGLPRITMPVSRGLLEALVRELLFDDPEQEVFLGPAGERYVPRLRQFSRELLTAQEKRQEGQYCLGFRFPGQLRNLRWEWVAQKRPVDDEVEIEVRATGLNFRDVMYALGLLSDEAVENGFAGPSLGLECSGVVKAVGGSVREFAVGDRVVAFGPSCFSQRVVTRVDAVTLIPGKISFEAAATIPSTFFTAYYALHHLARLEEGERMLIHGAAGGVGIAAIQIAKWRGAEIHATAGSDDKRDFLRLMGVKHIYDSRSLTFADEILACTHGQGVDVVLNSLAGEAINRNLQVLRPFGRFLELGKRDFYENSKIGLRPFRNNISYFGIDADQLMARQPQLTRRLFAEMMSLFAEGLLHPLPYTVFEADHVIDAFRHMQQARQIGKIVVTYDSGIGQLHCPPCTPPAALQLETQATYLVTGGLRGFGLRTAEWLVARGARHLVLISRSGTIDEDAGKILADLRARGVEILAEACDVTDREALGKLFERMAVEMPPLRGIVHAAMVIDDGLIQGLDRSRIETVLAPKILGAMNLHRLSEDLPLDFFVLFSSATTLFGNPGQGSYVAANAWLEAFAEARRACGQKALCVFWGAIDDAGFLARNSAIKEALQGRMGGAALRSEIALAELEALLLADRSGLAVLDLDWRALNRFLPTAGSPKFVELARHSGESQTGEAGAEDIQVLLAELDEGELAVCFAAMLKEEVGEILRIDPEKIDAERSLYDMGLDSLMGVELVTAVESRFGVRLQVMALNQNPSIARLSEKLVGLLKGHEGVEESGVAEVSSRVAQMVSQHGIEAGSAEVDAFVREIHDGEIDQSMRMID